MANTGWMAAMMGLALAFAGCGGAGAGGTDDTCNDVYDCSAGYACVSHRCLPDSADGDGTSCRSNLDCGDGQVCDTDRGYCRAAETPDTDAAETEAPEADSEAAETEAPVTEDGDSAESEAESDEAESEEPDFSLAFTAPADGTVLDGIVALRASVVGATPSRVDLYADTTLLASLSAPPFSASWDTSATPEGAVTLRAVAVAGGVQREATVTVTVDHQAPTLSFVWPTPDEIVSCQHAAEATLSAGDHLQTLTLTLDGAVVTTLESFSSESLVIPLPSEAFTAGTHTLSARADDGISGHVAAFAQVSYSTDQEAPQLVIDGPTWSVENPNVGTLHATTPLTLRATDASPLSSVSLSIWDESSHILKTLTSASDLPFVIEDVDTLLYNVGAGNGSNNALYPITLHVRGTVRDACGNTTATPDGDIRITVTREAWRFDPRAVDTAYAPDASYVHTSAPAADSQGNVYAAFYNDLFSLDASGAVRWFTTLGSVKTPLTFVGAPVVAERDGAVFVLAALSDGRLYIHTDADGNSYRTFTPVTGLRSPTTPSLAAVTSLDNGMSASFYFCGADASVSSSICLALTYTHYTDGTADSLSDAWNEATYSGYQPPSSLLIPQDTTLRLLQGQGRRLVRLQRTDGRPFESDTSYTSEQVVQQVAPLAARLAVLGVSPKELHVDDAGTLTYLSGRLFSTTTSDAFSMQEPVSDSLGAFFAGSQHVISGVTRGYITAYYLAVGRKGYSLQALWEQQLEGLMGGGPALGANDTLYVAGQNAMGNVWAFNAYPNGAPPAVATPALRWRLQLGAAINAPLTITPDNRLLVLTNAGILYAIELNAPKSGSLATPSWAMTRGNAAHTGQY